MWDLGSELQRIRTSSPGREMRKRAMLNIWGGGTDVNTDVAFKVRG